MVAIGSILQGAVGFGANLLAAPLLILIDPDLVPGPLLLGAWALNLLMLRRERAHGDWNKVGWALTGRVPGTAIGAVALLVVSDHAIGILFGVLILVAVGLSATPLHLQPTRPNLVSAGTVSGFMATTIGVGGPPMALLYQHHPGPVVRATLAQFFAIGAVISLVTLVVVGELTADQVVAGLVLMPGAAIGFVLSRRLAPILDRGWTRTAVLVVSAASALAVLIKELV